MKVIFIVRWPDLIANSLVDKEITVYDFYYPVKRIRNMRPVDFNKDLWMIALEAEKKDLIKITFKLPWGDQEKKDEIRNILLDLYVLEIKTRGTGDELNTINAWNVVREETISKLLKKFVYPSFEKTIRNELKEMAERYIIDECAKGFKKSINIKPYKRANDDENEQSRYKVLSCVSEGTNGVCHFALVDGYGELKDHLKLDQIGRKPGDDFSKKNIYNGERDELKRFMLRNYPGVIVVGTSSLACQQIKMELVDIVEEVLAEIQQHSTNVEHHHRRQSLLNLVPSPQTVRRARGRDQGLESC